MANDSVPRAGISEPHILLPKGWCRSKLNLNKTKDQPGNQDLASWVARVTRGAVALEDCRLDLCGVLDRWHRHYRYGPQIVLLISV